jgi:general secretion pathway protein A
VFCPHCGAKSRTDTGLASKSAEHSSAPPIEELPEAEQIPASLLVSDSLAQTIAPAIEEAPEEEVPELFLGRYAEEDPPRQKFLGFYGLREQPFGVTPDPAFLYLSQAHREALSLLLGGIHNDRGFTALIAEPGMGKTTLLNKLMEELRGSARTVFLFQTQCDSRELFRYLLGELGVESAGMDLVAMHRKLNQILFQEMLERRRFLLIIDEAQNLHDSVLETIRLLSDFETPHAKLLEIVLAGQPELAAKLARPSLSQLRQRIAVLTSLEPLSAAETAHYIEHRLRVAGYSGELLFAPDALALIAERSQGIPRNINNICFNALMLGCSWGWKTIDSDIVQKVMAKLDLASFLRRLLQPGAAIEPAPIASAGEHRLPVSVPAGQGDNLA